MLSDDEIIAIYLKHKLRFQNPPALQAALDTARAIESAARAESLESAAKVCDERQLSQLHDDHDLGYDRGAIDCAKDIRALKENIK